MIVTALLVVGACSNEPGTGIERGYGPGADTPEEAVGELIDHLNAGDFVGASHLAVPGHAALASLAEGPTLTEVADAITDEDITVVANFWAGFAQGSGNFLLGEVDTQGGEVFKSEGIAFTSILVIPQEGPQREMVTFEDDGWRIDVFASFGAGLAGRMIGPVERLLATDTEEARLVLGELRRVVPSLHVAAAMPDLPPELSQDLIRLIELITRVG
jgi:hypothetical protein